MLVELTPREVEVLKNKLDNWLGTIILIAAANPRFNRQDVSKVCFGSGMNSEQIDKILADMQELDLLAFDSEKDKYVQTPRGSQIVMSIEQVAA